MRATRCKRLFTFFLILEFLFFSTISFATEDRDVSETEKRAGFTVQPVLPENQINSEVSYFHLPIQRGENQVVSVKLMNNTDKEERYRVQVVPAATNKNGMITYNEIDKSVDSSMEISIKEIVKPKESEITVPAYGTVEAALEIVPPAEKFSGILLGGIYITPPSKENTDKSQGVSVTNTYGYSIGIVLTEDPATPIFGETDLHLLNVSPEIDYGSKIVEAVIQNPYPEAMEQLTVEGRIVQKGKDKTIINNTLKDVRIAPNSVFPFQLDWGMNQVTPGDYTFKGAIKGKDKDWTFEKNFTISGKAAEKMNKQTTFKIFIPDWWLSAFYLIGVLTCVVLLLLILRIIQRRKEKKK